MKTCLVIFPAIIIERIAVINEKVVVTVVSFLAVFRVLVNPFPATFYHSVRCALN